jgi:hypothetical protein
MNAPAEAFRCQALAAMLGSKAVRRNVIVTVQQLGRYAEVTV